MLLWVLTNAEGECIIFKKLSECKKAKAWLDKHEYFDWRIEEEEAYSFAEDAIDQFKRLYDIDEESDDDSETEDENKFYIPTSKTAPTPPNTQMQE